MSLELSESLGLKLKIWDMREKKGKKIGASVSTEKKNRDMIYFIRNSKTIINRALLLLQTKPYAIVERKPRIFPVSLKTSLIFLLFIIFLFPFPSDH